MIVSVCPLIKSEAMDKSPSILYISDQSDIRIVLMYSMCKYTSPVKVSHNVFSEIFEGAQASRLTAAPNYELRLAVNHR
jgi:hypothetical protein